MTGSTPDLVIFWAVVAARFVVPLFIPRFPLPAILLALVIDAADQTIFDAFTSLELARYQSYDKALDIFYLTIAYVSVLRNWTNGFAAEVARFLWYFRLVGVVLFEATEARLVLFLFPNTFEYFFIAYEVIRTRWDPRRLGRRQVLLLAAFIWVVIKLPQEWWIHVAQLDFTDALQEWVFGAEPGTPWGETIANRPLALAAIVAVLGLIAVLAWSARGRLPAPDWSLRFDVDQPLPAPAGRDVAALPGGVEPGPALRWPLVEKVVLISLVAAIFAQLLEVGASGVQIVVATAIVVVVNAVVGQLVVRGAPDWRRIGIEFAILAGFNAVLLSIYASLVADGGLDRTGSLFFGMLLTLIITLYDRYRDERLHRLATTAQRSPSVVARTRTVGSSPDRRQDDAR